MRDEERGRSLLESGLAMPIIAVAAVVLVLFTGCSPSGPGAANPRFAGLSADEQKRYLAGQKLYATRCANCHHALGDGKRDAGPPLSQSEWIRLPEDTLIRIVLHGLTGPISVDGHRYEMMMPPQAYLSDSEIAAILTFVRNAWGNACPAVGPGSVEKIRAAESTRLKPWTARELRVR